MEVTGSSAPLALLLSHSVDSARRSLTLRCVVHNRTMEAIKGVEVGAVGGGIRVRSVLRADAAGDGQLRG